MMSWRETQPGEVRRASWEEGGCPEPQEDGQDRVCSRRLPCRQWAVLGQLRLGPEQLGLLERELSVCV